jgi:beta-lactamase regulating signal transducer with metallopeptidase domain
MNILSMDQLANAIEFWFLLVILATWRAVPILILVVGIGLVFRRKLTPSVLALLLTLVVLRLLLPFSISSPVSLHPQVDAWFSVDIHSGDERMVRQPTLPMDFTFGATPSRRDLPVLPPSETQPTPAAANLTWDQLLLCGLACLAIGVSLAMIVRHVVSHVLFAIKLRACRIRNEPWLVDIMLHECDSLSLGRRPMLREVPFLAAPAVFGIFRPTICLPIGLVEELEERQLRWVLRHELAHLRRRDIPVLAMASLALAFHWFNPVIWLVVRRLRAAMEAAADRLALQGRSSADVLAYAELLLQFASRDRKVKQATTLGLLSFSSSKSLKHRMQLLSSANVAPRAWTRISFGIIIATLAAMGLTDASQAPPPATPEVHLVASDAEMPSMRHLEADLRDIDDDGGPETVVRYEVSRHLESIPESLKKSKHTAKDQLLTWIPLPPSIREKVHFSENTLIAQLPSRQHQQLKQTLEVWQNGEPIQITIEARLIQTDIETASAIDWHGQRIDSLQVKGYGPVLAAQIAEAELRRLVQSVTAEPNRKGRIAFAPKVTMYNGQTATIANFVQHPFVTGADANVHGKVQPIVSILDEGIKLTLTPLTSDQNSVRLSFEMQTETVDQVAFANLPIRSGDQKKTRVTVQVPETQKYELRSTVNLAEGESVILAIPRVFRLEPGADSETTMIVALTPRRIELP